MDHHHFLSHLFEPDTVALIVGAQVPLGDGEFAPGPALSTLAVGPAELDLSGLIADWTAFAYVRYSL